MATLVVEIVTPETALWTGEAAALMARSSEGDFTVLPQHTATVGDVVPGIVRVATSAGELDFLVHGGFFQVGPGDEDGVTRASVLAGVAERIDEIDMARAQAALEAAQTQLLATDLADSDRQILADALERAQLRLRVVSTARQSS